MRGRTLKEFLVLSLLEEGLYLQGCKSGHMIIKELGPNDIHGLPEGQTIKMAGTLYDDSTFIWEEYERSGNQVLTVDDVIEELEKIPKKFRRIITSIVLNPFTNPTDSSSIVSARQSKIHGQLTVYKTSMSREEIKGKLSKDNVLLHEIGHILDFHAKPSIELVSESDEWLKAEYQDSKLKRDPSKLLAPFYVTPYAQIREDSTEDFAESFKMLYTPKRRTWFIEYYPNRTKFIEGLLNDNRGGQI